MIVEYDDQIFRVQRFGGISKYFVHLAMALREDKTIRVRGLPRASGNGHLAELGGTFAWGPQSRALRRLLREAAAETRRLKPHRPRNNALLHHTFYDPRYLPGKGSISISTIHDMMPELLPGSSVKDAHKAKKEYFDRADALVFVSETTRGDCANIFGERDIPTFVTPLGVGDDFTPAAARDIGRNPYLLYVGVRSNYKDFDVLLQAFAQSRVKHEFKLLVLGGPSISLSERERVKALGISGRVVHRDFTDAELPKYYAEATCFVFPSRYEGFGLPTLEAMASGCPVVASDAPALKEVAGKAAAHFRAGDADSLCETLDSVLENEERRATLRELGLHRAAQFSWQRTAELTASAYGQALEYAN